MIFELLAVDAQTRTALDSGDPPCAPPTLGSRASPALVGTFPVFRGVYWERNSHLGGMLAAVQAARPPLVALSPHRHLPSGSWAEAGISPPRLHAVWDMLPYGRPGRTVWLVASSPLLPGCRAPSLVQTPNMPFCPNIKSIVIQTDRQTL